MRTLRTSKRRRSEIRNWLVLDLDAPERQAIVSGLVKGFIYLEDRLQGRRTSTVDRCMRCSTSYAASILPS